MKRITNDSLFELKSLANPKVAQNKVFFIETQMRKKENDYFGEIKSYDLDTKQLKVWSPNNVSVQSFDISPDQTFLSYTAKIEGNEKSQLFLMPLDGGSPIQLTNEESDIISYLWSKDSQTVYYQATKKEEIDADEKKDNSSKEFPQPIHIEKITYKNDGAGYVKTDLTYAINKVSVATKAVEEVIVLPYSVSFADITKDESQLFININQANEDELAFAKGAIKWIDLKAKSFESFEATKEFASAGFVALNPSETHYLLVTNDFTNGFVTHSKLYVYEVATKKLTNVLPKFEYDLDDSLVADFQQAVHGFEFKWLDDKRFIFSATVKGEIHLFEGNLKGEVEGKLSQSMHLTSGIEESGRYYITYSTPTVPSRLAVVEADKQLEDLYNPNEQFEAEHEIVNPERFWFKGYDNWDIQGWYLAPITEEKQHPAILYVHGGPQVAYGESFFHEMQALAQAGYGIIMLNPRGGSSYSQEFVAAILGEYGHHDYDDLMLGVDYVLAQHPEIDQDRLFVAGGSYGGFMTNWIVGHTDRFKAAVSQRSISNWISFYGVSDIGMFFVEYQLQRDLSDVEGLWKLSPLAYAQNVKTPIRFLHGQSDLRCPQEQAEQMYIAMKKHGVETDLILYPQSSHGLSREGLPNLRMERLNHVKEWFDRYK